jgi:hypothetical protein
MAAEEGIHERVGKGSNLDNRHQAGLCDLPERCLRKLLAPQDLPASDGPPVGAESPGQLTDSAWRRPLPHGADYDDDDAEVDLWAEEAHRRRCRSLPATLAIAAEAQPETLCLGKLERSAPGLPKIVGAVEMSAARTCVLAGRLCKISVDGEKNRPQSGGAGQIVIHRQVLRGLVTYGVHPSGTLIQ